MSNLSPEVSFDVHLLEQHSVKLRDELNKLKTHRDELAANESKLEAQLSEEQRQLRAARVTIASLEGSALDQKRYLQRTQNDLTSSREDLERLKIENERLNGIIAERAAAFTEATSKLGTLQQQLFDVQAKHVPLEFERDKLMREKEALAAQNTWLDTELQTKANDLCDIRSTHANEIAKLRSQLNEANANGRAIQEQCERQMEENKQLRMNLEKVQRELHEEKSNSAIRLGELESALSAEKLAGVAADQCKALAQLTLAERNKDVEQLRLKMEEIEQSMHEDKQNLLLQLGDVEADSKTQLSKAEEELERLKNKLREVEQEKDSLAQAKRPLMLTQGGPDESIKEAGGTLSEILGALHDKDAELRAERVERQRLEAHLDTIITELERKGPMLEAQRRDYKRALDSYDSLNEKLANALRQEKLSSAKANDLQQRLNGSETELKSMRQQNADLSRQVQHLLQAQVDRSIGLKPRAVQTPARYSPQVSQGRFTPTSPGNQSAISPYGANTPTMDAHDVVTENLVVVSDVAEMQRNNMSLIATVRTLTDELEKVNVDFDKLKKSSDSDSEKDMLYNEIEEMRSARQRQEQMIETIIKQRDIYRLAANGSPNKAKSQQDGSLVVFKESNQTQELATQSAMSAELESSFRSQIGDLERQLARANDERDIMKQAKDQYAAEASQREERTSNAVREAVAQSERARFIQSRLDQIELDLSSKNRECQMLQRQVDSSEAIVARQQADLGVRDAENVELSDRARRLEEKLKWFESRQLLWEESEKRLKDDSVRLRSELKQMSTLVDSVQRIETGIASGKADELASLISEKDKLAEALEHARSEAANTEVRFDQLRSAKEEELKLLRSKLESLTETLGQAQSVVAEQKALTSAANAKVDTLENQIITLTEREERRMLAVKESGGENASLALIDEFEQKEKQLQIDLSAAQEELAKSSENEKQWRGIAGAHERALTELGESMAKERTEAAAKYKALSDDRDSMSEEMSKMMTVIKGLEEERMNKGTLTLAEETDLKEQYAKCQSRVKDLESSLATLQGQVASFTTELQVQRDKTDRAQQNYERELQLHVEANKAVRVAEGLMNEEKKGKAELVSEVEALKAQLVTREAHYTAEKSALDAARKDAVAHGEELAVTNSLLHAEVQRLGAEVDQVQETRLQAALGGSKTSARSSDENSGMRQVIQSLQKEKGLLEARLKSSAQQLQIKEQMTVHMQRELEEARASMRAQTLNTSGGEEQHSKLMAQLEENSMLRESNTTLREETKRLNEKLKHAEVSLKNSSSELEPLRESLSEMTGLREASMKECEELKTSLDQWRHRVETLTKQYKLVDPEDHARVKAELDTANSQLAAAREEHAKVVDDMVKQKETQLKQLRDELVQEQEKAKQDAEKASKEIATHVTTITSLEKELSETKTAKVAVQVKLDQTTLNVSQAEERVSKLKDILRKAKTEFAEKEKKWISDAQSKAATEAAPVVSPTPALATKQAAVAAKPPAAKPPTPKAKVQPKVAAPKKAETPVNPPATPATTATAATPAATPATTTTTAATPTATPTAAAEAKASTPVNPPGAKPTKAAPSPVAEKKDETSLRAKLMVAKKTPPVTLNKPATTTAVTAPKSAEEKPPAVSATAAAAAKPLLNPFAKSFEHLPPPASQEDAPAAKKVKAVSSPPKAEAKTSSAVVIGGAKDAKQAKQAKATKPVKPSTLGPMTGVAPTFGKGKVSLPVPSPTPLKPTTFATTTATVPTVVASPSPAVEAEKKAKRAARFSEAEETEPASKKPTSDTSDSSTK